MNLQENIERIHEIMGIDNTRHTFDIQKLVDNNIIFVTKPGDGQGGIGVKLPYFLSNHFVTALFILLSVIISFILLAIYNISWL